MHARTHTPHLCHALPGWLQVDRVDSAQLDATAQHIRSLLACALPYLQPVPPHGSPPRGAPPLTDTDAAAQSEATRACRCEEWGGAPAKLDLAVLAPMVRSEEEARRAAGLVAGQVPRSRGQGALPVVQLPDARQQQQQQQQQQQRGVDAAQQMGRPQHLLLQQDYSLGREQDLAACKHECRGPGDGATTTTTATSTCTCVSSSSGSSSGRSSEDGQPSSSSSSGSGGGGSGSHCSSKGSSRGAAGGCCTPEGRRTPLLPPPSPHIIPIFAVSAVTGEGLPVLHAFLQSLQPASTAAASQSSGSNGGGSTSSEAGAAQAPANSCSLDPRTRGDRHMGADVCRSSASNQATGECGGPERDAALGVPAAAAAVAVATSEIASSAVRPPGGLDLGDNLEGVEHNGQADGLQNAWAGAPPGGARASLLPSSMPSPLPASPPPPPPPLPSPASPAVATAAAAAKEDAPRGSCCDPCHSSVPAGEPVDVSGRGEGKEDAAAASRRELPQVGLHTTANSRSDRVHFQVRVSSTGGQERLEDRSCACPSWRKHPLPAITQVGAWQACLPHSAIPAIALSNHTPGQEERGPFYWMALGMCCACLLQRSNCAFC